MTDIVKKSDNMAVALADRDSKIGQLEKMIHEKKRMLVDKRKDVDAQESKNEFLVGVNHDYNHYYNSIVHEKQEQIRVFHLLKEYLEDLTRTEQLVDRQLKSVRRDEEEIMQQINHIKYELDEITGNTKALQRRENVQQKIDIK